MLREKLSNYSIILASGSPRRQQFFKELDIPFSIQIKEVEEIYPEHLVQEKITDYLARLKSQQFTDLKMNEVVITSDTIVWFDNKALGKPKDYEEAFSILRSLSDAHHEVFTSICIKTAAKETIINDRTKVYFKVLSDEEIHYYIETHKPFDKAGSYGIQDWIGLIGIDKIEGSYFNVMGLPVHKLYKELMKL